MGGVIEVRTSDGRSETLAEGRRTRHSFSFGAHYDPRNVGFASLVAHNDELLPPGTGYADHPHADTEIVSWVVDGALRHASTVGSREVTAGSVQRLSAGSGVVHSEVAAPGAGTTRFLQAWVRPDEPGAEPSYDAAPVVLDRGWTCLVGADGRLGLGARGVALHAARLDDGDVLALPDALRLHLFVVSRVGPPGGVLLAERQLLDGDAARLLDEGARSLTATGPTDLLVWAFD